MLLAAAFTCLIARGKRASESLSGQVISSEPDGTFRCKVEGQCDSTFEATVSWIGDTCHVSIIKEAYQSGDSFYCVFDSQVSILCNDSCEWTVPSSGNWWAIPFDPDDIPTIINAGSGGSISCYCNCGAHSCEPKESTVGGETRYTVDQVMHRHVWIVVVKDTHSKEVIQLPIRSVTWLSMRPK